MKKTRKFTSCLLVLALSASLLTACGGTVNNNITNNQNNGSSSQGTSSSSTSNSGNNTSGSSNSTSTSGSSSSSSSGSSKPTSSSSSSSSSSQQTATYTVTLKVNSDLFGTVSGDGSYEEGEEVELIAEPKAGYAFSCWQMDGENISTSNPYTFTASKSITLTAVFEQAKVIWTTTTTDGITTLTGYSSEGAIPAGDIILPTKLGGKTITKIGRGFLKGNKYITSVTIPGTVDEANSVLKVYGWGVTDEIDGAFENCTALKQVTLSANMAYISRATFSGCTALEKIYIPSNITSIQQDAFKDCSNLNAIYYGGSEADWEKVSVGSGNDYLNSVENVYFNQTGF